MFYSQISSLREDKKESDVKKLSAVVNIVCASIPYLSGLAASCQIMVDNRCKTACVFPSGRMLFGGEFLDSLTVPEAAFVLAHELLHLMYSTHQRSDGYEDKKLVNIAHDLIINSRLENMLSSPPPGGGLNWGDYYDSFRKYFPEKEWKEACDYSLEEMLVLLKPMREQLRSQNAWSKSRYGKPMPTLPQGGGGGGGLLGDLLQDAGIVVEEEPPESEPEPKPEEKHCDKPENQRTLPSILTPSYTDVLSSELELQMFPDEAATAIDTRVANITKEAVRAFSEAALQDAFEKNEESIKKRIGKGTEPGNGLGNISLLRGAYQTPWEAAMQRWFDSVTPGDRTYAKASRRGAWRTDVVLPGRKKEGWTLHIVLDTSGSMSSTLSSALGAIDQFCQNNGVEQVHILQCDVGVTEDEFVELGDLAHYEVKGFGGSDMSPAMLKLAEAPDVEAVIVLTDGRIYYPQNEPPYETLWCIVDGGNTQFNYGTAIRINNERSS